MTEPEVSPSLTALCKIKTLVSLSSLYFFHSYLSIYVHSLTPLFSPVSKPSSYQASYLVSLFPFLPPLTIARVISYEFNAISASVSGETTCFRLTISLRTTTKADQHMKKPFLVMSKGQQGSKELRVQDSGESKKKKKRFWRI